MGGHYPAQQCLHPVTRSNSGRCFMKMHLVPAGTPGGACHVVPASRMETLLCWIVSSSSLLRTTGLRLRSVSVTSTGSDMNRSQPGTLGGRPYRRAWWATMDLLWSTISLDNLASSMSLETDGVATSNLSLTAWSILTSPQRGGYAP